MVTELDHDAIMDRIVQILQADPEIFNKDDANGKIRQVIKGVPAKLTGPYPFIFIAFGGEQKDQPFSGIQDVGSPMFRTQPQSLHHFQYFIIVYCHGKDGADAEKQCVDFHKKIKERLKLNVDLRNPIDGSDAKVKHCHPVKTDVIQPMALRGDPINGLQITLACQAET